MLCGPDTVPDLLGSPVPQGSEPPQSMPTPHNSLVDIIRMNAEGPKSVSGDSGSVQQHSMQDLPGFHRFVTHLERFSSDGRKAFARRTWAWLDRGGDDVIDNPAGRRRGG